jgi:hypothetical protein
MAAKRGEAIRIAECDAGVSIQLPARQLPGAASNGFRRASSCWRRQPDSAPGQSWPSSSVSSQRRAVLVSLGQRIAGFLPGGVDGDARPLAQ